MTTEAPNSGLTHFNQTGQAHMVDVAEKKTRIVLPSQQEIYE
jgi:molybdenum cofactor biosynthesis enzyme